MLTQLIDQVFEIGSIPQKFKKVEEEASTLPTDEKGIMKLLKLCRFRFDEKEYPVLKQTEVFVALLECKQVLVESDNYYFI